MISDHVIGHGQIFVFGSNLAGRHGKGAAREAWLKYGAQYGKGIGRCAMSYAIPTKDQNLKVLPLLLIKPYVSEFIAYAQAYPYQVFFVTAVGTGLAGYTHEQIAPMFKEAPSNCRLPPQWNKILGR